MNLSDFNYALPIELIAQNPEPNRDDSRLMIYNRTSKKIIHANFKNITDFLSKNDILVINNSKVMNARFRFPHDGKIFEILILKKLNDMTFDCMVNPGKKFKPGIEFKINEKLFCKVNGVSKAGRIIVFYGEKKYAISESELFSFGAAPLPPYIEHFSGDFEKYQTVYSKITGSSAAPTAGLHFTKNLLKSIKSIVSDIIEITLHIGPGTFQPIKTEDVISHKMHSEYYNVEQEAFEKLKKHKSENKRIIAVGTTSVRVLETIFCRPNPDSALTGETDIFIYPGYNFKFTDALITNFHLPKSSLLLLVSAFAGREDIMNLYDAAIKKKYRFFSFGD
nr:tRNA preQ1(34) S-adenosylmethionine ribosyltransferase-isomerase QueA [bacterium]